MHRSSRLAARFLAAAATPVITTVAIPAEAASDVQGRHVGVEMYVAGGHAPSGLLRAVLPMGDIGSWASAADYPEAALAAEQVGYVRALVAVDASGRITGCTVAKSDSVAELQQLACRLIRERGRFRHALSRDGKPVASTIEIGILFRNQNTAAINPPAPPAPPYGSYAYSPGLLVKTAPDWKRFAPPGNPDGDVVIELSIYPAAYGRPEHRYCFVTDSSGNAALDAATCEAAKSGEFAQIVGANRYSSGLKMLVRWRRGDAQFELPKRSVEMPLEIAEADRDFRFELPAGLAAEPGRVEATFNPDRTITCRVVESTGNDQADLLLCARVSRIGFTPRIDLFGRNVPSVHRFRYNP